MFLLHDLSASSLKKPEDLHLSAPKIKVSLREVTNTDDYYGSARNVLGDHNANSRVVRKKLLGSQVNRLKRFPTKKNSLDFWKTVVIQ